MAILNDGDVLSRNSLLSHDNSLRNSNLSVVTGCYVRESTTPAQNVSISSGEVLIGNDVYSISSQTFSVSSADATNPRWDLIYVDSSGTIQELTGTAAASPTRPSIPSNSVPLAYIYRAATDNTINNADIYDHRPFTKPLRFWQRYEPNESKSGTTTSNYSFSVTFPSNTAERLVLVRFYGSAECRGGDATTLSILVNSSTTCVHGNQYGYIQALTDNVTGDGGGVKTTTEAMIHDVDFSSNITLNWQHYSNGSSTNSTNLTWVEIYYI